MSAIALAAAFLVGLTSCEKEVTDLYQFTTTIDVSESGSIGVGFVTMRYIDLLRWNTAKTIDNEAASEKKAQEENDAEALMEYNENLARFNMQSLQNLYIENGVTNASGSITYRLVRVDDQRELASNVITVNYTAPR